MKRMMIAFLLLPLACRAATTTRLTIPAGPSTLAPATTIRLTDGAAAQVQVAGLALAVDPADGAAADLILRTAPPAWGTRVDATRPLRLWDTVAVRKGGARLRITALPDLNGRQAALMLDFGPSCRILVHGGALGMAAIEEIPRRYPGARLALLRDADGPLLLTIAPDGTAATLQHDPPADGRPACAAEAR